MTQGAAPAISVAIPVHSPRTEHLRAALGSIVEQGVASIEVVAVDDASPDAGVPERIRSIAAEAGLAVRVLRNDHNVGAVANWNVAVRATTGALVLVLGQDDVLGPGMLGALAHELEDQTVMAASCGELFIDDAGRVMPWRGRVAHRHHVYVDRARYRLDHDELVRLALRNGQPFGEPSAVLFRRTAFDRVGGYDETLAHAADVDFCLRLAAAGPLTYLRAPLLRRRRHEGALTRRHLADGVVAHDRHAMAARYLGELGGDGPVQRRVRAALAARGVLDLARAVRNRAGVADAWRDLAAEGRPPVWSAGSVVCEILTRRNLDER